VFGIGEFARHGRVSVRMLRHYDAIGLLRPAQVDPDDKYDFAIVDLPGIATAATVLHHGSMDNVVPTGQALEKWIEVNGTGPPAMRARCTWTARRTWQTG
jgi:hypothetical protein